MDNRKITETLEAIDSPCQGIRVVLDDISKQVFGTLYGNLERFDQQDIKDQLFLLLTKN